MCAIPLLCSMKSFVLRGPVLLPPSTGWRIQQVPESAAHLQNAWASYPSAPTHSKEAWGDMLMFLKANGFKSAELTKEVVAISTQQWCSGDPKRCRGMVWGAKTPYLPWARAAWEQANYQLADGTPNPGVVLVRIVRNLTTLINGPDGCPDCARHWVKVLAANPIPPSPTLHEARHWLVDAHNETRENKTPVPFDSIAAKFNWTNS